LKPGVTLEQANGDVRRMIPQINAEFGRPGPSFDRMRFGPNLRPLKEWSSAISATRYGS